MTAYGRPDHTVAARPPRPPRGASRLRPAGGGVLLCKVIGPYLSANGRCVNVDHRASFPSGIESSSASPPGRMAGITALHLIPIRVPPLHVHLPGAGTADPVRLGARGRVLPRGRKLAPVMVQGVRVLPERRPGVPRVPSNACSSLALSCLMHARCATALW